MNTQRAETASDEIRVIHGKSSVDPYPQLVGKSDLGFQFHLDVPLARVLISGEIDVSTRPRLEECTDLLVDRGARKIDFDLFDVRFLDSQGLCVFISAERRLRVLKGGTRILRPQPNVRKVFAITGVDRFIEIVP